jgi:membrane protein
MSRIDAGVAIGRSVVEEAQNDQITFLAASIAYYAFTSIIPLLLFLFLVASTVGGQGLADRAIDQAGEYLAPAGQDAIEDAITGEEGRGGATIAGFLVLVWSALKLFRGLDTAFSIVYDAGLEKSIVGRTVNAVVVFSAIVVAAMGMIALGTVLVVLPDVPFGFFTPLFLIAGLTLVFLPMYYFLPDVETISVRQALPGSFLAASGWAILHTLFGLYASNAGQYDAYGVVGAILLLLTWLYVGGIVIILGALLNYVLMDREDELPDDAETADRSPL